MQPPAVEVQELGKAFRRYPSAGARLLEAATLGRLRRHEPFWALRGVTFSVRAGCALGLVGRNGAGKSTLLRLLARALEPSEGRLRTRGRMQALLELGTGFQGELTGRENIVHGGLLSGLSRAEIRARQPEIEDLAGLGSFLDEPLRTYSSGMALRLFFAVALASEPDVLVLDEVLAVGDQEFQERCVERVLALKRAGRTILFSSHSLYDVRLLCDEALWLERGRLVRQGESAEVTHAYAGSLRREPPAGGERPPRGAPAILDARLVDPACGGELSEVESGAGVELCVRWSNPRPERGSVQLGVVLLGADRSIVAAAGTHLDGLALRGESGLCTLEIPSLALVSGSFLVSVLLFDASGLHRHDELVLPAPLVVRSRSREVGLVRLAHAWRVEPCEPALAGRCA